MGANSGQGWSLFAFLVGFTSLVAGLAYLGPVFAIVGLGILIGSLVAFYRLKPLENASGGSGSASDAAHEQSTTRPGEMAKARRA